jgi:hypothetical protein
MKKIFCTAAAFVFTLQAFAYRVEYGTNVYINQPVYEDLYIAGGTITINAPVFGDLVCAGGVININDTIGNDIIIFGGTITFDGVVGDDIRCAGGQLYVHKNITGDLVIAGGMVSIGKNVIIGGGLLIAGGEVTLNGIVTNSIKAGVGTFVFNGRAEKDMDIRGGEIQINGTVMGPSVLAANKISISDNASFNNDVRYWSGRGAIDFGQTIKKGKATFDPSLKIRTGRWYYLGKYTVLGLLWYIGTVFLMITMLQYLFGRTLQKSGDTVFNTTLKSLGYGALFFVAVPVITVIAFITIIGVPVGLLLVFNYIMLILLATVITSLVAAHWLNNRFKYNWGYWRLVFAALGCFVVLKILSMLPFLGWLIMLLTVCMAFGAILLNINWKRRREPAAAITA